MASIKRKVTIKRKTPEVISTPEKEVETPIIEETSQKKSNKWGWIILACVAVVAVASGFIFFGNNSDEKSDEPIVTEVVESETEADVAAPQAEVQDSVASSEVPTQESTTEASAPAETVAHPSETVKEQSSQPSASSNVKATTSSAQQTTVSGDVNENAIKAIRGDFGNGEERKNALGSSYGAVQARVNEMYRNGLVK